MTCALPRCREETAVIYFGHEVCEKHWQAHCDNLTDLRKKLQVKSDGQLTLR